ncbi:MAG: glycosyltransferase [Opitutales bacterium]|nr:glycosyltransferase [Opitutales bacterium]
MIRLTLYDDSAEFGGHQVMAHAALRSLLRHPAFSVTLVYNSANTLWVEAVERLEEADRNRLNLVATARPENRLARCRLRLSRVIPPRLIRFWTNHPADAVLFIQNSVEQGCVSLAAARAAGKRIFSYIPLYHGFAQMEARFGEMRDAFNRSLLDLPHAYITITRSMAEGLRRRGADQPIEIVENGIDWDLFQPASREAARAKLGWSASERILGQVGRIDFTQKAQDFLLRFWEEHRSEIRFNRLVFVGTGPDFQRLARLVRKAGLADTVTLTGWVDPVEVYPALDALIIPSRYEGLPLVMLEAIACGLPVAASDRDGMADVLPHGWRYPAFDDAALVRVLRVLPRPGANEIETLRARLIAHYRLERFEQGFAGALQRLSEIPWIEGGSGLGS